MLYGLYGINENKSLKRIHCFFVLETRLLNRLNLPKKTEFPFIKMIMDWESDRVFSESRTRRRKSRKKAFSSELKSGQIQINTCKSCSMRETWNTFSDYSQRSMLHGIHNKNPTINQK